MLLEDLAFIYHYDYESCIHGLVGVDFVVRVNTSGWKLLGFQSNPRRVYMNSHPRSLLPHPPVPGKTQSQV